MASKGNWTVVFEDKLVIKNYAEGASEGIGYKINNDAFWSDSKFSNIWAIQYGTSVSTDEVEYRDETPHSLHLLMQTLETSVNFLVNGMSAHLTKLQS
jgi:hypothetical protein